VITLDPRQFPTTYQPHDYLIKNVSLIDPATRTIVPNSDVRVRNGIIEGVNFSKALPSVKEEFDAAGLFLMPGLIDMHVHLVWDGSPDPLTTMKREGSYFAMARGIANARKSLACGVTTLRDLGSVDDVDIEIARVFDSGLIFGPTVVPAGRIIQPTGGHVPEIGLIADSRDELVKAVRTMKARGAGVIKVAATGGAYGPEEIGPSLYPREDLETMVREAHRLGLPVASHALGKSGITCAVHSGIDTIEHGANIPDEVLQEMKSRNAVLVPTLAVYRKLSESHGQILDWYVEKAKVVTAWHRDTIRQASVMGVAIALGTDAGSPNFGPHPSVFIEMETMIDYGLSPWDTLAAATIAAAAALKRDSSIGSIGEGKKADLILLEENPVNDIRAMRSVKRVIKNGIIV
jgi:imidazolonepropionase-like amidohydrolase